MTDYTNLERLIAGLGASSTDQPLNLIMTGGISSSFANYNLGGGHESDIQNYTNSSLGGQGPYKALLAGGFTSVGYEIPNSLITPEPDNPIYQYGFDTRLTMLADRIQTILQSRLNLDDSKALVLADAFTRSLYENPEAYNSEAAFNAGKGVISAGLATTSRFLDITASAGEELRLTPKDLDFVRQQLVEDRFDLGGIVWGNSPAEFDQMNVNFVRNVASQIDGRPGNRLFVIGETHVNRRDGATKVDQGRGELKDDFDELINTRLPGRGYVISYTSNEAEYRKMMAEAMITSEAPDAADDELTIEAPDFVFCADTGNIIDSRNEGLGVVNRDPSQSIDGMPLRDIYAAGDRVLSQNGVDPGLSAIQAGWGAPPPTITMASVAGVSDLEQEMKDAALSQRLVLNAFNPSLAATVYQAGQAITVDNDIKSNEANAFGQILEAYGITRADLAAKGINLADGVQEPEIGGLRLIAQGIARVENESDIMRRF